LVIILLAIVALTVIGPVMAGISPQQQAKAAISGKDGKGGTITISPDCNAPHTERKCAVIGGKGGVGNVQNEGMSFNGNGGDGGSIAHCQIDRTGSLGCFASGGNGGWNNSQNSGTSHNGNGGNAGTIRGCSLKGCSVNAAMVAQVIAVIVMEIMGMVETAAS
jgi:hypothetical protein